MKRSLRLRLLFGTSAATAVVLTLLGVAIYFSMWRSLLSEFDGGLLTQAQALGSMVEQHGRRLKFEFDAQQMPEFNAGRRPEYFEIRFDGEKVLARSHSLGKGNLAAGASSSAAVTPSQAVLPHDIYRLPKLERYYEAASSCSATRRTR